MWRKSASILHLKGNSLRSAGWIRQIQSASYLVNPGSEPLTIATVGDVIAQTAQLYPGRVAVKSLHEGVTLTYEELLTQADSLGCALRAQGLQKGDRFGLWSHNSASWIVAIVAAARAGLISVLINPVYEHNEISFCLKKTQMKGILIGEKLPNRNYYGILEQLVPELHTSKPGDIRSKKYPNLNLVISAGKEKLNGTLEYNSLLEQYRNGSEISKYGSEIKPEDGCLLHFTSGTTGEPKAALDSHLGVVNNSYFTGVRNELNTRHQNICIQVPLFHALGSIIMLLSGLRHGSTITLAGPTYNVRDNIKALLGEKCSVIAGTPTMYVDMLGQLVQRGETPSDLQVALTAGAPCSPQLIRDMQKYMKAKSVKALYGLTEATACVFQSLPGDSIDMVAETVGYITDHIEVKVVDENGEMVPFGSPGELLTRGYNNMICYWDEPEKTKKAIDKDGWVFTGDQFAIGQDGYGRIVGRLKDIIVRGGENIAPKEIEDLLNTHPDIIESQVVGVSDERLGEELCAVLRLREGATVTLDDVTKHCTGQIARYKIPRILKVAEEFPKTTSGKIQKHRVKELIDAGKL